jgi:hypothetical protein
VVDRIEQGANMILGDGGAKLLGIQLVRFAIRRLRFRDDL